MIIIQGKGKFVDSSKCIILVVQNVTITFLHFSSNFTVILPVPGPTSNTTSVGVRAAYNVDNKHSIKTISNIP